ncbi:di-trans,poly-cis-decaprenylcistransferase [Mycolicibacterium moriokaense]|uniref:(2Z,6E)-farnesyl diphosphate synthase n=1 Tax=Mycolicibacterium moriokaense TaxID=39691 RepID=A0AAD1M8U2_9MYCO|nr:undecaprenyl diphosphate synthase family protein [Mycolicibacterium moriokaense]MCV7041400.1 undecaprenyl diphosphate synthase family protein [Mycolicibacterium moriokaense]ORB19423.1 di-trans,poly-cis-decaprenylcistransferase [Mycolicibacterium moriokaense]BBX04458.1 isoprenyl transferase 1 [Mycolicibacterium moriokaense]
MNSDPAHVGLIPDGLRRWAKSNDATLDDAYLRGAEKVTEILLALQGNGVRTVSVYNLSQANLGRQKAELDAVYAASLHFLTTLLPDHFDPAACRVRLHGNRDLLPHKYVAAAEDLEAAMTGSDFHINILSAYDASDELRAAHERARREGCDITAALEIGNIDLIIRTTPEQLLSGFLPLQSQYAQLVFLPTPLNDLTEQDIDDLIAAYRRFPKLRGR